MSEREIISITAISDTEADAAIINSIPHLYKKERQESKAITFALTR